MLLADRADVPPDADDAMTARATATRTTALMVRALMDVSPKRIESRSCGSPTRRGPLGRERIRLLAYTTLPRGTRVAHDHQVVKTTFGSGEESSYAGCLLEREVTEERRLALCSVGSYPVGTDQPAISGWCGIASGG